MNRKIIVLQIYLMNVSPAGGDASYQDHNHNQSQRVFRRTVESGRKVII